MVARTHGHGVGVSLDTPRLPHTVMTRPMSVLPFRIAGDQNASLFDRLDTVFQVLRQEESVGGQKFWQHYLRDERSLRTVNLGEEFTMSPFERGASAALRTVLRHLFDILRACNGLVPHRDHFSLLLLTSKFHKASKTVFDRSYRSAMLAYWTPTCRGYSKSLIVRHLTVGQKIHLFMIFRRRFWF